MLRMSALEFLASTGSRSRHVLSALITLLATGLGALVRHLWGELAWRHVRQLAREIARDPKRTDNPEQAMAEALLVVKSERIKRETLRAFEPDIAVRDDDDKITDPFVRGTPPVPWDRDKTPKQEG